MRARHVDAPIRLAAVTSHRDDMAAFCAKHGRPAFRVMWPPEQADAADLTADLTAEAVTKGALWWVSPEMSELVDLAAQSMPSFDLRATPVPDIRGVVFFGHALTGIAVEDPDGRQLRVSAMSWAPVRHSTEDGAKPGLMITSWDLVDAPDLPATWAPSGVCSWYEGQPSDASTASEVEDRTRLAALWTLAAQEGVADLEVVRADRPSRRRAERAGRPVPLTKVIRLRRPRSAPQHDQGAEDVHWSHRWIVGGHWRNQWYPARKVHLPRWIAPYVKGPEDRPLVVKDTVKALVR